VAQTFSKALANGAIAVLLVAPISANMASGVGVHPSHNCPQLDRQSS
jgi:hypothetical protein